MPVIGIKGVKGGTGTTSIVAGLSWALHLLDQKVIMLDLSPKNLLRLHFNVPVKNNLGWARAQLDKGCWEKNTLKLLNQLYLIPYGELNVKEQGSIECFLQEEHSIWSLRLKQLISLTPKAWIIIDIPADNTPLSLQGLRLTSNIILTANADGQCHTLLNKKQTPDKYHFLLNKLDLTNKLESDINQLWKALFPDTLLPLIIHKDASVHESMALKAPPGKLQTESLATKELLALASWCLMNFKTPSNE